MKPGEYDMRLKDKVVVVTGASAGMGREMTKRFAEEGACVVAVARRREVLEGLQKECEGFAGKVEIYAGDCGSKEVCEGMIQYAVEKFGKLDALVNNAGIMDDMAGVGDFQDEFIDKIFNLNTFGVLYAMRAAIRQFLTQERTDPDLPRACILNISSIGAQHANAGVVYCASKAAVESATKHTAFMYMEEGIRCNAIAPGGIMTDIFGNMPEPNEEGMMKTSKNSPLMGRLGRSDEIAAAAVFLISDEASYVNGQILGVNGGWMCY